MDATPPPPQLTLLPLTQPPVKPPPNNLLTLLFVVIQVLLILIGLYFFFFVLVIRPKLLVLYQDFNVPLPLSAVPVGVGIAVTLGVVYVLFPLWNIYKRRSRPSPSWVIVISLIMLVLPIVLGMVGGFMANQQMIKNLNEFGVQSEF